MRAKAKPYPGDIPRFSAVEHERVIIASQKLYRERNRLAFAIQLILDGLPGAREHARDVLKETYDRVALKTMERWSQQFTDGHPSRDAVEALHR